MVDINFFEKDSPESFYWAGFIAADGCVVKLNTHGKSYMSLAIALAKKDENHLIKFKKAISATNNINYHQNYCKIVILSDKIVADLERFNIVSRKTKIYRFPEWIISHKFCNHFVRGYFDGDGCFSVEERNIKKLRMNILGTKDFIDTFCDILKKYCGIKHAVSRKVRDTGVYVYETGGNRIVPKIRDYLYKDANSEIFLERKYDIVYDLYFKQDFKGHAVIGTNIKTGEVIKFSSLKGAEKNGFTYQCISACCRGKNKTHMGYTWRYL